MADSFIQVAPDGGGKELQTYLNAIAGHNVHAEAVTLVDTAGAPITTLPVSGPLTDTQLRATPVPVIGTVATGGLTDTQLRDSAVPVSLASVPPHAVTNAGTFAVQSTEADGANVALGAKADAKNSATDTTAITVMSVLKQISFSIQAAATSLAGSLAVSKSGASNLNNVRGTASTSAATLAVARATRRGILIRNLDSSITIYVGPATVTSANGFPILPGESCPFSWVGLIQVIAASGTPAYAACDEYD